MIQSHARRVAIFEHIARVVGRLRVVFQDGWPKRQYGQGFGTHSVRDHNGGSDAHASICVSCVRARFTNIPHGKMVFGLF